MKPGHGLALLTAVFLTGSCGSRTPLDGDLASSSLREQCNGKDDDGDGLVDEDIAPQRCGRGACEETIPGCASGVVPPCKPRSPSPEICDGIDNDCNGAVDDSLPFEALTEVRDVAHDTALATALGETPTGLRAFWRGADLTIPNLRTVAIDEDGRPAGGPRTIPTRPMGEGPRLTTLSQGGFLLGYCGAVGGNEHRLTALDIDFVGNPRGAERTHLDPHNCGGSAPEVLVSGSQLFAMTTNQLPATGGWMTPALVESARDDGTPRSAGSLVASGSPYAPPRFARGATRVGWVAGTRPTIEGGVRLAVGAFSPDAQVAVGAKELANPRSVVTMHSTSISTVGDDRFMVVARGDDQQSGIWRAQFTADGTITEELTRIEETDLEYDSLALVPSPPGYVLAASATRTGGESDLAVFRLSHDGAITSRWVTRDAVGSSAWPAVVVRGGKVYVLYAWLTEGAENAVRLVVLGCR